LTTSYVEIARFIISELVPDIENRPTAILKANIVEIMEMLAQADPKKAEYLRRKAAGFVMIPTRDILIKAICGYAASLKLSLWKSS